MKKSLSVLLVLILLTGMIPFACASDIDSFDPVKQLNDQTIWTWIEINGSLYIDTDINPEPSSHQAHSSRLKQTASRS